jgi:hypothetical protein
VGRGSETSTATMGAEGGSFATDGKGEEDDTVDDVVK